MRPSLRVPNTSSYAQQEQVHNTSHLGCAVQDYGSGEHVLIPPKDMLGVFVVLQCIASPGPFGFTANGEFSPPHWWATKGTQSFIPR